MNPQTVEAADKEIDPKTEATRLLDILVNEVSIVNRAANKRRWLVRKGSGDMNGGTKVIENSDGTLSVVETDETKNASDIRKQTCTLPKPVKEATLKLLEQAGNTLDSIITAVAELEVSGEMNQVPPQIAGSIRGVATVLQSILSKYPSSAVMSSSGKTDKAVTKACDETPEGKARRILWAAMKRVDDGAFQPPEEKSVVDAVIEALKAIAKSEGMSDEQVNTIVDKAKELSLTKSISEGAKKAAQDALKSARDTITTLTDIVRNAEETDEQLDNPLPEECAKLVSQAITALEAVLTSYPSPETYPAAMASDKACKPKPKDEEEEKKDTAKSEGTSLDEAFRIIGVVMARLSPGKPIDEASYAELDKVKALLETSTKSDSAGVAKSGAKMSKERRARFEEAINTLMGLFKEVMPEETLNRLPHSKVAKSASEVELQSTKEKLDKANGEIASLKKQLQEKSASPTPSNVVQVDVAKNSAKSNPGKVVWPRDMNEKPEN